MVELVFRADHHFFLLVLAALGLGLEQAVQPLLPLVLVEVAVEM